MALRQKLEPEDPPQRGYGALPSERSVRGGARFARWGVLWLILIGLFIWWAGWGWDGSGGWWWRNRARNDAPVGATGFTTETAFANTSGTGIEVLNATNKRDFVGRPFQVNEVTVESTANGKALWIGSNRSSPMLTILKGPGNSLGNADIHAGDLVNVTGTVEKAPPAEEAQSQWQLSRNDLNRLEQEGVYIQAMEVTNARR